jgi:hypothetical protein
MMENKLPDTTNWNVCLNCGAKTSPNSRSVMIKNGTVGYVGFPGISGYPIDAIVDKKVVWQNDDMMYVVYTFGNPDNTIFWKKAYIGDKLHPLITIDDIETIETLERYFAKL